MYGLIKSILDKDFQNSLVLDYCSATVIHDHTMVILYVLSRPRGFSTSRPHDENISITLSYVYIGHGTEQTSLLCPDQLTDGFLSSALAKAIRWSAGAEWLYCSWGNAIGSANPDSYCFRTVWLSKFLARQAQTILPTCNKNNKKIKTSNIEQWLCCFILVVISTDARYWPNPY